MKRAVAAVAALVLLGLAAGSLFAVEPTNCTEKNINIEISQWSGVPWAMIKDTTLLDGLGGRSWPEDAQALISRIQQMCGCHIPPDVYETFSTVDDIDQWVGADDLDEDDL